MTPETGPPEDTGPLPAPPGPEQEPPAPGPVPRARKGYWIPGLIAMAALLVIGGAIGAGDLYHGAPQSLHGSDVASEIALGIQAQEAARDQPQVTCPADEPVRTGLVFTCRLTPAAGGPARPVTVTEIDARGHLRWVIGSA